MDDMKKLNTTSVNEWGWWRAGQWHSRSRLWSRLSPSVGWRCTSSFVSPACLGILWGAILAWKAAGSLVLMKHCRVSLYRSLHLFVRRKLNTPLLLYSGLAGWFLNEVFRFIDCAVRKAFYGHIGHIHGQALLGLFQLYPTTLPCHSSRHVENQQDISCCF